MANANIFSEYLKQPKSVQDYLNDDTESEIKQQTARQNALVLAASQEKSNRENAFRKLAANLPSDPTARITALRAANTPEAWDAATALEKQQAETGKLNSENEDRAFKTAKEHHDFYTKGLLGIAQSQDPINAANTFLQQGVMFGTIKPEHAQMLQAQMQGKSPEEIKQGAMLLFKQGMDAEKQLPKNSVVNTGGKQVPISQDVITGNVTQSNGAIDNTPAPMQQDPNKPFMPDGTPNKLYQRYEIDKATAGSNKPPSGYVYNPDGSMKPITGGPADPTTKKCSECLSEIPIQAKRCSHCAQVVA
jgi:hypothetical protein